MAKKSGVPTGELQRRMARVKYAEKMRNDADLRFGWSRNVNMYLGNFKSSIPTSMTGIDLVPINEVYAYAKTFVPSIYSRDPYIAVNPKGKKYVVGSKILELTVNAYWRELKLKRQIRRCIFDAIFAEGWIKCGYSAALGDMSKPEGEKSIAPSEYIKKEEIFAQRVSWRNIVRDPDAVDGLHDARFLAHQIILPLDAVKASKIYENTEGLEANYSVEISSPAAYKGGPVYKTEEAYVVLWEEWNRDDEKVYTYAEGHDKYLMNKDWPYRLGGSAHTYPFEMIRFNEAADEPYAPNLISPWEAQLWEKIKIRSMEMDHLKRFGRQLIADKGVLSKVEMDKFKKGITGSIIEKEPGKEMPQPIPYPAVQSDMYAVENRIDLDKDNISGQPNAVRSAPQKTQSRTLGEIDRLMSSFQAKQSDPQLVLEDFSEEVAKTLIGLMQQYFKKDRYVRASGIDARWLEAQYQGTEDQERFDSTGFLMRPSDIKNLEFEVEVRAGSSLPLDKKQRIASMTNLVELGERMGIVPGGKTAKVIGKNLIADFDMPEITAAYEEDIQKLKAAEDQQKLEVLTKLKVTRKQMERQAQANGYMQTEQAV